MEEVGGIPGQIPALVPFPTAEIRQNIPAEEWQASLDAWNMALEIRLRLLPEHFKIFKFSQASSGVVFLSSYFSSLSHNEDSTISFQSKVAKESTMRHFCFMLLRRLLLEGQTPYDCSPTDLFRLLANASLVLRASKLWKETLQQAWQRQSTVLTTCVDEAKSSLVKMTLGSRECYESARLALRQLSAFSICLPQAGKVLTTGSDYIDFLSDGYNDVPNMTDPLSDEELRKLLVENLYFGLQSLMNRDEPSASLLLDNLYVLKTIAETWAKINPNKPTLLSNLICSTSFFRHLENFLVISDNTRGSSILKFLQSYGKKMSYLHPVERGKRKPNGTAKGKAKANANGDIGTHEMHIHKASRVSQIHELFPDLPTSYVLRLLDHFSDDVEIVTAALLEPETLPASLRNSKDNANSSDAGSSLPLNSPPDQAPTPSFVPRRKNIFDDDDFDKLQVPEAQVHIGRKENGEIESLEPSEKAKRKAAIMAALATFDSDDDERDDTYDIADVGGAVDNTIDADESQERRRRRENEEIGPSEQTLFRAWTSNPEVFARDSKTRLSQPRQQLKSETGMTNEQIEGWALVLSRNSSRQQLLEKKYAGPAGFSGQQKTLGPSKWSAAAQASRVREEAEVEVERDGLGHELARGTESSTGPSSRGGGGRGGGRNIPGQGTGRGSVSGRGRGRGRGRGSGGGGGGGGPNHNRREGRARKVAGRGFGGSRPPMTGS